MSQEELLAQQELGDLAEVKGSTEGQGLSGTTRLERAVSTRMALLARLYVQDKLSKEEEARLAIADAEFMALAPRISGSDIEELRRAREEVARMRRDLDREWKDLDL